LFDGFKLWILFHIERKKCFENKGSFGGFVVERDAKCVMCLEKGDGGECNDIKETLIF